jgi:DNA polymerase-3 subunit gamma/tau
MGYDLRAVCRELSRVVRDLLVLSVDASRISDPEIAGESERDRLKALGARFSREDLLRAFDLLTKAETDIRTAAQPRYHLEMALLRWIYLRKLVPIEDLIGRADRQMPESGVRPKAESTIPASAARLKPETSPPAGVRSKPEPAAGAPARTPVPPVAARPAPVGNPKDAFMNEIKKAKNVFYQTVVAQAQKIDVSGDRITFTFGPNQRTLKDMFDQNRGWLESVAHQAAGRRFTVVGVQGEAAAPRDQDAADADEKKNRLRERALADSGVQAMLEVFPAEIRDVEEM